MYPIDDLIGDFVGYLDYFAKTTPVDSKYRTYLATVQLRKDLGSAAAAMQSDEFLETLHNTMANFFGFGWRKILLPIEELKTELRRHSPLIESFDGKKLGAEPNETADKLWELINQLKLTTDGKKKKKRGDELETADKEKEKSKLVSGSKALHLLLPDLVVPIDRTYTGAFLYRYNDDFNREKEQQTFRIAFATFGKIAKAANPEAYVGTQEVHANLTKTIDNGVIGFVGRARAKFQDAIAETQTQELAYGLFEKRGRVDGDDLTDWFEAEAILHERRGSQPKTPKRVRSAKAKVSAPASR